MKWKNRVFYSDREWKGSFPPGSDISIETGKTNRYLQHEKITCAKYQEVSKYDVWEKYKHVDIAHGMEKLAWWWEWMSFQM